MVKLYIQRQIRLGEEVITEAQLLERSKLIVVLAEPGAGKTDLLLHIANMLRTESVRASRFRSAAYLPTRGPIVIDAMDEVAKIGDCALNDIIVKASEHSSGITVLASRSGEWENARTKFVEECFYLKPTIVYLEAFNTAEQKRLFDDRFSGENFEAFASEAASFDLTPLLGNPEFLQILGHAYRENNRHFSGKSQIYSDATKRLAQETNEGHSTRGRPEAALMVRQAGSIFARLTLSGASGISRKENIDDRNYPYVAIVAAEIPSGLDYLLDSKLFKPASDANEHEPVHRIVAEYLAAQYLVGRISDAGDRLSLKRCLAVIAPNNVVRDELRGLLGWMAALGGDAIQKAAVALDPYAVLSNGDPAQLLTANKLLLIERLQQFAKTDPYFRRSDSWRSFNVGQFFSDETVAALRPVLAGRDVSHLRGLILDLIKDTPVVTRLVIDLENLIFDPDAADHERIAASRLLFDLNSYDTTALFDVLLAEASPTSLKILTQLIVKRGTEALVFTKVLSLLRALASLYPKNQRLRRSLGMSRYFLKEFFRTFPSDGIESYLDELTDNIRCICNARHRISCECTRGISKIIGGLLDRYFEARAEPYDPDRIRRWTWNPNFSGYMRAEDSPAVRVLSQNHELRRTVQRSAFARARLVDECNEIASRFWMSCSHSGLLFQAGDAQALIKCAFEENRVELWESLWRAHDFYQNGIPNPLRTMMREQAQQNTEFQKIWAKKDRDSKKWWRVHRSDLSTRSKRYTRREEENKAKNLEHLHKNRKQIEAGQHWGWLRTIAHHYLYEPQKLSEVVDDIETAHKALRNCFPFLSKHVPTMEKLAMREGTAVAMVLYAACVLRWRETGTLNGISPDILKAVKTETNISEGIGQEEAEHFENEIDGILFQHAADIEQFARQYIEPFLAQREEVHTKVEWLVYKTPFQGLQTTLPLEWLRRFPEMPLSAETALFKMVAKHSSPSDVRALIAERVTRLLPTPPQGSEPAILNRRSFWLLNSFFYDDNPDVWNVLKADKNNLLSIAGRSDRFVGEKDDTLPSPSAEKLYKLLDTFVEKWPEVELPSSFGTGDPPGEQAYRYLREIPWRIGSDMPEAVLPVLDRILVDERFKGFWNDVRTVKAQSIRKMALSNFRAPLPAEISAFLEHRAVASVEDMRALMAEVLLELEAQIRQSETDTLDIFYPGGHRVDENTARNRLVEHLRGYMTAHRLSVVIEHHMADSNRCDITATEMLAGKRHLLVIEVKGQWHPELFSAASAQLETRYACNPDAEQQGIYLVLWFGQNELVAGRRNKDYRTPDKLRTAIVESMPPELRGRIDIQMINLCRPRTESP